MTSVPLDPTIKTQILTPKNMRLEITIGGINLVNIGKVEQPSKKAICSNDLLAVMGENPNEMTAKKAAWMLKNDKSKITGFVLTSPTGLIGIVDKSAVRWLVDKEMWWLMHDSPTPITTNDTTI